MLKKTKLKLMLIFTTFILGVFLAGCSSQTAKEVDKDKPVAEQPKVEEVNTENTAPPVEETPAKEETAVNKAQMMAANFIIAEQGVHTIAEELEKGNNDEGFLRSVQKAKATIESIEWTGEVEEVKEAFYKDVIELEKALIAQDYAAAVAPAKAAHESQHELDKTVGETVKVIIGGDAKAQMMIANYIIAKQGVHLIAEELEKGPKDESFLRSVQKVKTTIESIEWTAEAEEVKEVLYKDVIELEKALIAQDYKAAVKPAKGAHESQHELDKTVGAAVKAITGGDAKAQMMIANYIIADQGVHLIAEELEKGTKDEGFLRSVQKAKATIESIEWTAEVEEMKEVFYKDITGLEKALIAQDFTAAEAPAKAAHESQHELDKTVGKVVKEMESVVTGAAKADTEKNDATAEGTPLTIVDWGFESLTLKTGKKVITATNTGKMPHGVLIPDLGVMSEDIGGGETLSFKVDIKEPGTYKFYCSVPECGTPEQHGGMIGEIVVK